MSLTSIHLLRRSIWSLLLVGTSQPAPDIPAERALAASVSEQRMVETVRKLVGFGTRMYGTPSNHESASWLASEFKRAGLDVQVRLDTARDWYQPVSWEIRATSEAPPAGRPASLVLKTTWPSMGAPSARGDAPLSAGRAAGAVCLVPDNPTPESTTGCVAVLFDGRVSASGWPTIGRLRGTWTIPVFVLSPREANPLRDRLATGENIHVTFALDARSGNSPGETVIATLPGKDHSKVVLFCAHGDADSGGPGADDNASGVATVLEIARTAAAAIMAGKLAQPGWDMRFAGWGGEMASTRQYLAAMEKENGSPHLEAVFNYDQAGFGSTKAALYVEPDDIAVNSDVITLVRAVMKDHLGTPGFPEHAASIKSQGGTDSYVFQNTRTPGATVYPAVTLYTSAWDKPQEVPLTAGFPPLNWYAGEKPGRVTVDGDPFYHSVGDTPANTTDTQPHDMGWCARVGLLSALRMMAGR